MTHFTWLSRANTTWCTLLLLLIAAPLSAQLDIHIDHPAYREVSHGDTVAFQCSGIALLNAERIVIEGSCEEQPRLRMTEEVEVFTEVIDGLQSLMSCTFYASDSCYTEVAFAVHIAIYDTIAPLLQDVPQDLHLPVDVQVPTPPHVYAIDNCSRNLSVDFIETVDTLRSQVVWLRSWSARDEAGNIATAQQRITQALGTTASSSPCTSFEVFASTAIEAATSNCNAPASVCLTTSPQEAISLRVNGRSVSANACSEEESTTYNLSSLSSKQYENYELVWAVGAGSVRARITSLEALDSVANSREPEAQWTQTGFMLSGSFDQRFGQLQLINVATGSVTSITPERALRPIGLSVNLGTGQHTIVAMNDAGCSDTVLVTVSCEELKRDEVTAVMGITGSYCLTLPGEPSDYDVDYDVADNDRVIAPAQVSRGCLTFSTLQPGQAVVLLNTCQQGTSICERLELTIRVVDREDVKPPTAVGDLYGVAHNGQRMFDVTSNDEVAGGATSVRVVTPTRGTVRVDAQGRIHYTAPLDWCGDDSFRYEVCNPGGCDETLVTVQVTCEDLIVFNGFSPNNDGQNDEFTVLGIENYPDNSLVIFNQHGHEVFTAEGYNNTWQGTHNGTNLVDGTYFYVLSIPGRAPDSGYVQIKR